ncbi:MAG TPA: ABC transporter ATP-binding protein [Pirellulales bacterium]|nr:ABC transporter ATP-binding protein [Pirellulales bacterium]
MAGVVLTGVSRVFSRGRVFSGGILACDRLDLEVRDGELLVLVGPSGSGKTTILRLIAGLERPTSGTITIGGQAVDRLPPRERNLAMVFQGHALHPQWTVYDNIAFGLRLRASAGPVWRRSELRQQVVETARELGLDGMLDRLPGELSGGEQQRVALARAIVRRPTLFLFDEPFSSLDAQLRVEMRRKLKQLHQRLGTSMIYVTHDQSDALALADRLAVLDRGRIEQVGTPREVYDWPASRFVAGFVGSPGMNFFEGKLAGETTSDAWRLSAGGWSVGVRREWWRGAGAGETAVVGLRPEDIHVRQVGQPGSHEDSPTLDCPETTARVELIEDLGDASVVSLSPDQPGGDGEEQTENRASPERPGAVLLCKRQVRSGLAPGEHVIAWLDMRRAHWFDGRTGRNLCQPGAR